MTLKSPSFKQPLSLRSQVSFITAILVFFTNFGMILLVFLLDPTPDHTVPQLRLQLILWLVVMSSLTSLIAYAFSWYLLLPLSKLNEQLVSLREQGRRLRKEDIEDATSVSEIKVLRETLSELLEQIATEQSRRNAFVATLVHDLKTPLIATGHLLRMIEENDNLPKEERIALIGSMHLETERLIDLVQKMVDAYKYERKDIQLNRMSCSLEPIVTTVVERVKPFAEQRSLHIQIKGTALASVDTKELERAIYNLLTNAVRYADKEIYVDIAGNCIRILDDGPGLPQPLEELARPFNGQPADIAGQRYATGTGGLGLFIAKSILEAHGGRLADESKNGKTVLVAYFL